MDGWQVEQLLKEDAFGRVERVRRGAARGARRVASGGRLPGSAWIARRLLARERRALQALEALPGVPPLLDVDPRGRWLVRGWIDGAPLHRAEELALDFFDLLDARVEALHGRGVCHNDLHKEQNVIVGADRRPHLIDFQLASVHRGRGRLFGSRVRDDLRHVQKHRRRYTREGRAPEGVAPRGSGHGVRRSLVARAWRRAGKPVYNWITRGLLRTRDGEERRPSSGPWPRWGPPAGPGPAR